MTSFRSRESGEQYSPPPPLFPAETVLMVVQRFNVNVTLLSPHLRFFHLNRMSSTRRTCVLHHSSLKFGAFTHHYDYSRSLMCHVPGSTPGGEIRYPTGPSHAPSFWWIKQILIRVIFCALQPWMRDKTHLEFLFDTPYCMHATLSLGLREGSYYGTSHPSSTLFPSYEYSYSSCPLMMFCLSCPLRSPP